MKKQMKKPSIQIRDYRFQLSPIAVACATTLSGFLVLSSVAQASDMQIYASPTAGQKTIVMMLDTSGSMGVNKYSNSINADYSVCSTRSDVQTDTGGSGSYTYTRTYCSVPYSTSSSSAYQRLKDICYNPGSNGALKCYDRMSRLQDGMFAFLDSNNSTLVNVKVGLGHYSVNGDGNAGKILVPADTLGVVGSAQRNLLKDAVDGLTASGGTPTATAYAEAAAYLMGTSTLNSVQVDNADIYFYSSGGKKKWYKCAEVNSTKTACTTYDLDNTIAAPNTAGMTKVTNCSIPGSDTKGECYKVTGMVTLANSYSGFNDSVSTSKKTDLLSYSSPLPAAVDRVSCDGQGVYVLSDGEANSMPNATTPRDIMRAALGSTGSGFTCPTSGGLTNLDYGDSGESAWHCMGELATKLFNGGVIQTNAVNATNPVNVPIQTAFVGFGSDFNAISESHVQQACKLSSRTQSDRTGEDACSPNAATNAQAAPGFGNGGFFTTQSPQGVTASVISFINNLGAAPLAPLTTGAISVPVDALNPNGFQPYGYLRALKPQPGKNYLIWQGNLKKYNIIDGALKDGGKTVFTALGALNKDTKDLWNASALSDQGLIEKGGVYEKLRLPTVTSPSTFRTVVTDIAGVNNGAIVKTSTPNSSLLTISSQDSTTSSTTLLDDFKNKNILKDLSLSLKVRLLNYLGYDLDLATTTTLPATLTPPKDPFVSMGASIHSYPVQLTYSGDLDANGDLTDTRQQSVLYASMEGGLRIVDAQTGAEQMVFLPADILNKDASRALRRSEPGSLTYGVDGAWVADSAYKFSSTSSASSVIAKQMNVYGGMRMGGESYYGLDVLTPKSPKFLFRVGSDLADYSRMGQTWSKPVLANIRYNNKITRVMIVGGGYDACYENPQFRLGNANPTEYGGGCNKTEAQGNAIYIIDAQTGKRLWWASSSGANINNSNMKHSIVSRISTLDRDADGLVDHLYVGDLGGQVFRVDLNNAKDTPVSNLALRVVRLANLGSDTIASGNQPRFYQPPTITIHDSGTNTFILVGIASGDRSTPLDVSPTVGREGMLPSAALTGRPTNKVFGLIDRDFINKKLNVASAGVNQVADGDLKTKDIALSSLQQNPQNLSGDIATVFFGGGKEGWYRSLSSDYTGSEVSGRTAGGIKAFEEEPMAITNYLYVPVYDPQGTGVEVQDPCKPRIIGETDIQQFCLPFGVCLNSDGKKNSTAEAETGFQISGGKNLNVVGIGIRGITLGPKPPSGSNPSPNSCGSLTLIGNTQGKGTWECKRLLNPIRWYERYVTAQTK